MLKTVVTAENARGQKGVNPAELNLVIVFHHLHQNNAEVHLRFSASGFQKRRHDACKRSGCVLKRCRRLVRPELQTVVIKIGSWILNWSGRIRDTSDFQLDHIQAYRQLRLKQPALSHVTAVQLSPVARIRPLGLEHVIFEERGGPRSDPQSDYTPAHLKPRLEQSAHVSLMTLMLPHSPTI